MKDYKFLKRKDKAIYNEKTKRIELAYDKYKDNKTDENVDNWYKEVRSEINV